MVKKASHDDSAVWKSSLLTPAVVLVCSMYALKPPGVISYWRSSKKPPPRVALDDNEARKEIIRKKMLSGEFDKFRVWEGKF